MSSSRLRRLKSFAGKHWLWLKTGRVGRISIGLLTITFLSLIVGTRILPPAIRWQMGDTADRTVYAHRLVTFVDEEATEKLRAQAGANVSNVYRNEKPAVRAEMLDAVEAAFRIFGEAAATGEQSVGTIGEKLPSGVALSDASIRTLLSLDPPDLESAHARAREIMEREAEQETRSDVQGDVDSANARVEHLAAILLTRPRVRLAVQELCQQVFRPNQILDLAKTQERREETAQEVEPVMGQVHEGEAVIRRGDVVTQKHLDKLGALGLMRTEVEYDRLLFMVILIAGCVLAVGFLLAYYSPEVYQQVPRLATVAGLALLGALLTNLGSQTYAAAPYIVLFSAGFAGLTITALLGVFPALMGSVPLTTVAAILLVRDPLITAAAIVGGFGGIMASRGLSFRPLGTIWLGVRLGLGNFLGLAVIDGAVTGPIARTWELWPERVGGSLAAGLGAVIIGLYGIRLFERPLETVTEMRLLELSNPQEPLLHEFMTRAPGSYNSALHVANLARNAAEAISANALLTWVGAMYHDVGKIHRPYFFTENQFGRNNPHDDLNPFLSALVVIVHVKEGVELGRKAGLPKPILDFIMEHHGTSLASYFYEKAKALEGPANVPEERFRYPGPRPRSKETGILMLADSVEAAVRSLKDPTAHTIEIMVRRVIDDKIAQGQLEECPLSLRDIATIRESFIKTFHAIYHTRVEYPSTSEEVAEQLGVGAPSLRSGHAHGNSHQR